jgi:hypothetical protein
MNTWEATRPCELSVVFEPMSWLRSGYLLFKVTWA